MEAECPIGFDGIVDDPTKMAHPCSGSTGSARHVPEQAHATASSCHDRLPPGRPETDDNPTEDAMRKLLSALALASAGCLVAGAAMAEPVKIALIETLSGGQAAVGKMFLSAVNYGLIRLNDEKAWPDGIKILEYDNQGGASEASDKVKAAINDGADIIIQGASSAIGGQITADVLKHNLRNPGKEVIYLNVGAEAMEFT